MNAKQQAEWDRRGIIIKELENKSTEGMTPQEKLWHDTAIRDAYWARRHACEKLETAPIVKDDFNPDAEMDEFKAVLQRKYGNADVSDFDSDF